MKQKDIMEGLSEIYWYSCQKCGQGNLSRDEVHQVEGIKFICLRCHEKDTRKSNVVDTKKEE